MTVARAASLMVDHAAISRRLRAQPKHRSSNGSPPEGMSVHTCTQGVAIGAASLVIAPT